MVASCVYVATIRSRLSILSWTNGTNDFVLACTVVESLLMAWILWFLWMNNSITPPPSPHSVLLQMLWLWYWVTNVILMMLGLSAQREGNWWECPTVCVMISRHMYIHVPTCTCMSTCLYLYEYLPVPVCVPTYTHTWAAEQNRNWDG